MRESSSVPQKRPGDRRSRHFDRAANDPRPMIGRGGGGRGQFEA